jgi:hypothetical protein
MDFFLILILFVFLVFFLILRPFYIFSSTRSFLNQFSIFTHIFMHFSCYPMSSHVYFSEYFMYLPHPHPTPPPLEGPQSTCSVSYHDFVNVNIWTAALPYTYFSISKYTCDFKSRSIEQIQVLWTCIHLDLTSLSRDFRVIVLYRKKGLSPLFPIFL